MTRLLVLLSATAGAIAGWHLRSWRTRDQLYTAEYFWKDYNAGRAICVDELPDHPGPFFTEAH